LPPTLEEQSISRNSGDIFFELPTTPCRAKLTCVNKQRSERYDITIFEEGGLHNSPHTWLGQF